MPAPTQYTDGNLSTQFPAGALDVRRKTKVNPFQATSTPGSTTSGTLPPAPPVGLVYPR